MRRGYRLNSISNFQARQRNANFGIGEIARAGLNKVDDAIRYGAGHVAEAGNKLSKTGSQGGIRQAVGNTIEGAGNKAWTGASKLRNSAAIAGGVGAVGLGGLALGKKGQQQRPMM